MTPMVVYDCQKCGSHSARRIGEMPWICDHCGTRIDISEERDIAIVFVDENTSVKSISNKSNEYSYVYSKEIFTERGVEAYERV